MYIHMCIYIYIYILSLSLSLYIYIYIPVAIYYTYLLPFIILYLKESVSELGAKVDSAGSSKHGAPKDLCAIECLLLLYH